MTSSEATRSLATSSNSYSSQVLGLSIFLSNLLMLKQPPLFTSILRQGKLLIDRSAHIDRSLKDLPSIPNFVWPLRDSKACAS